MNDQTVNKKKHPGRIIAGAVAAAALAALLIYVYRDKGRLPQVDVLQVSRGDVSQTLDVTGRIESENTRTYYSGVAAIVIDCDLEKGDEVKKGERLLSYDTSDLETALEKARLNGRMSELDEEDADGFNQRKSDRYDEAQEAMDQRVYWISLREEDLHEYQDRLIDQQTSDTPDAGDIAGLQFDVEEAETDIQEMKQQLTNATNTRDAAKEAFISDEQQEKLAAANQLSQVSIADLEEDLSVASAGVDAEWDGVVTEAFVKSGAAVTKGQPLLTIASADDVSVRLELGQKDLSGIAIGQKAVVTSISHRYSGTVDRISHTAVTNSKDKQVAYVYVRIDDPDEYIIIDMEAKAQISLGEAKDVLFVPAETLHEDKDDTFCYVLEDGIIRKRTVTTGLSSGTRVQITDGLAEGDTVLYSLPDALSEGDGAEGVAQSR